jgi:pimeloyl-ACP methyl ester carboxylesterase
VRRIRAILVLAILALAGFSRALVAQTEVSFPTQDGGIVYADLYGTGKKAVVLAHGGQFNKESWAKQAHIFVAAGYCVLAIDFRGFGKSHGPGDHDLDNAPLYLDVLAAVRYLHKNGAKWVSIVGGSMGGSAAGDASIESQPGEIDRLVLLGAAPNEPAEKLKSPLLIAVARDDANDDGPRLPGILSQYDRAPQPKELVLIDGSEHAQHMFETSQSDRVMREILRFLAED